MVRHLLRSVVLVGILASCSAPVHGKDIFGEVWGVIEDPTGLGKSVDKLAAMVERIAAHLKGLQGELDADVTRYIAEINGIVDKVNKDIEDRIAQVDQSIEKAVVQIAALEQKVFADTLDLIECSGVLLNNEVNEVLARAINTLAEAEPTAYFLWFPVAKAKVTAQDLPPPATAWKDMMNRYAVVLNNLTESSSANIIPLSFGEMQRATLRVLCHYRGDNTLAQDIVLELADLRRRGEPWIGLTTYIDWK